MPWYGETEMVAEIQLVSMGERGGGRGVSLALSWIGSKGLAVEAQFRDIV